MRYANKVDENTFCTSLCCPEYVSIPILIKDPSTSFQREEVGLFKPTVTYDLTSAKCRRLVVKLSDSAFF